MNNCKVVRDMQLETETAGEAYCPVHCATCDADIGVMDQDDIYHFFHVIPSVS